MVEMAVRKTEMRGIEKNSNLSFIEVFYFVNIYIKIAW